MTAADQPPPPLTATLLEIEQHVGAGGWDQGPQLFALVPTVALLREQPQLAATLNVVPDDPALAATLTPVEQDALPDGPLDEALASIEWPDSVAGCALVQEVLALPPAAEAELPEGASAEQVAYAASHPDRQEIRLAVAVLRDGSTAATARVRSSETADDGAGLVVNPGLAPELASALLATLD